MDLDPQELASALDEAWRSELRTISADGVQALVLEQRSGEGKKFTDLKAVIDNWRKKPERVVGKAMMQSPESFIELVRRHAKVATAALFCDMLPPTPSLTAVIDYHGEGAEAENCKHRIHYPFPISDEWKFWMKAAHDSPFGQGDFAFLIEDRIADVASPSEADTAFAEQMGVAVATPAQLLTLSRGLTVRVEQTVKEIKNNDSGQDQIVFEESHTGENGGALKVPGMFVLAIPAFSGDAPVRLPVRLRYRMRDRKIAWFIQPYRPDVVIRENVKAVAARASEQTGLPLFFGLPEA